jgi:hypothetical protein
MSTIFPHEKCFKALNEEIDPEGPNLDYSALLESLVGRRYLREHNDRPRLVYILEQHVIDPRPHQNNEYRTQPPPDLDHTTQSEGVPIQPLEDGTIQGGPIPDENRSSRSTLPQLDPSTPPIEVSDEEERQLQVHTQVADLSTYTVKLMEDSAKKGLNGPSYTSTQTQSKTPCKFVFTVTFEGFKAVGKERTSKQEAKHEASKVLWEKLYPELKRPISY